MPAFIHDRAQHILAKNPSMQKGTAFALATQQSHALGKSPKGYGTSEGKAEAKEKYDGPKKEYKQTANPGKLQTPKLPDRSKKKHASLGTAQLLAFADELDAINKEGGLKEILMSEIPGTKPWVLGNAALSSKVTKPMGSAAAKAISRPKVRMGQLPGGAWDVSQQAAQMGI